MASLLEVEEHFAFGENWQSFAKLLDSARIEQAEAGLKKLFPHDELKDRSFLDIGCGSGLSSLAAARLGVAQIDAVDLDPASVAATEGMLSAYVNNIPWTARVQSVFDLDPNRQGQYDVVHSWGVLHHTGDMWKAVKSAAAMVKPGGYFAVALYKKTPMCGFWLQEKRFYSRAPRFAQTLLRALYKSAYVARVLCSGRNPVSTIRNYAIRGMNWSHDVHDWLGGYPYESASPREVRDFLKSLGFSIVREFLEPESMGLFGSGCNEFIAVHGQSDSA